MPPDADPPDADPPDADPPDASPDAIARLVMRWQDEVQAYDEAVGARWGLNAAERHGLSLICAGPLPPGVIARAIGLAAPSVTALVDRLEDRGFVTRERDPQDRRRMRIALGPQGLALAAEAYGAIGAEGRLLLEGYGEGERAVIARFLNGAIALQGAARERLAAQGKAARGVTGPAVSPKERQ